MILGAITPAARLAAAMRGEVSEILCCPDSALSPAARAAAYRLLRTAQNLEWWTRLSTQPPPARPLDLGASTAALLKDRHHVDPLSACQTVTSPAELEKLIAEVSNIHVADRIYDYIAELVDLTRSNAYVTLGVSPRGALAVTRAAKANAYLEGRDYVIPDDVCAVFPDVCVHRLILNSKARLQDYTAALILQNVLTSVQKPDVREFSSK